MKNPLSNGRIVEGRTDYLKRDQKRGQIDYPMSRSELMSFAKCPSKWIKGAKDDESTTSTDWGSLVDMLLMTPEKFNDRFAIKPATYLNDKNEEKAFNLNSKWCKEWVAGQGGKTCVDKEDWQLANLAVSRLTKDPAVWQLLDGAKCQLFVEAEYQDKDTSLVIPIRCLIDIIPFNEEHKRKIVDFKTSQSANLSKWARTVNAYDYDAQGAMYLDAWNSATDEARDMFIHLIQESDSPFEAASPMLSEEFLKMGRNKYQNALKLYCRCLQANIWPGYNDLACQKFGDHPLVEPEPYMLMTQTNDDPDWMNANQTTDQKAA